ncbi:hypothetical protein HanIR_Chr04g0196691 [Helianthus annuus]|nr:hypothetical protein HanIR_Chr04g0196691 [Helianthus annuus]
MFVMLVIGENGYSYIMELSFRKKCLVDSFYMVEVAFSGTRSLLSPSSVSTLRMNQITLTHMSNTMGSSLTGFSTALSAVTGN